jgi:hypothetical protein
MLALAKASVACGAIPKRQPQSPKCRFTDPARNPEATVDLGPVVSIKGGCLSTAQPAVSFLFLPRLLALVHLLHAGSPPEHVLCRHAEHLADGVVHTPGTAGRSGFIAFLS